MIVNLDFSTASAEARSRQEDPWVMYFLIKESLGMSRGKTAAQVAHAATMICEYYHYLLKLSYLTIEQVDFINSYKSWNDSSFRKITLSASDKDFEESKNLNLLSLIVKDAGLTEINPGSETVIVLQPILRSKSPKLIKNMRSLK